MITKIIEDIIIDTDLYLSIDEEKIETIANIYEEIIDDPLKEVNKELFEEFAKKVAESVGFEDDINWVDVGYEIFNQM